MTGKHIAGIVVALCFGAIIVAAHEGISQPAPILDTPAIVVGGCTSLGGNNSVPTVVNLGGTNQSCRWVAPPLHGVPVPSQGKLRNLRVTGGYDFNAEPGSVITVYINGSPTALSCTVGAGGTCGDQTDAVTVRAGDEMSATFTAPDSTTAEMNMSFEVCLSKHGTGC
jgi:hypothetical protein